jgi:hypothetical protein
MSANVRAHLLFISARTGRCQTLRGVEAQPSDYAAVIWHQLTRGVVTFITCEGRVIAADARRAEGMGETQYKQEIAEELARLTRAPRRAHHRKRQVRRADAPLQSRGIA